MTIKAENTLNEIAYAGGYFSNKPIETTATASFAAQVVTGSIAIGNDLTVGDAVHVTGAVAIAGTLSATGVATLGATGSAGYTAFGLSGPRIISGTLAPPINPTGITAPLGSLFINLGATGVTNRLYINTDGATAWTFMGTAGA